MPRVIFLNRFYWPDEPATAQLLTDLAESLARLGFSVTVIASRPAGANAPSCESRHGVEIRRMPGTRWGRHSLLGRAFDFATFIVAALWRLLLTVRRGDVVVPLTDPPFIGAFAWPLVRLRGAHLVHWVQDIYPEIAIELSGQQWLRVFRPLRNLAWRRADHCVVLGDDMAATLRAAGVPAARLGVIPNWAPSGLHPAGPAEIAELKTSWGLAGMFVAAYSGNLGRVHDLEPLLDVAAALRTDTAIAFVFIGAGAQQAALASAVHQRGLTNVRFLPSQPRDRLAVALGVGDLHFVTLRPGCEGLVFPSKLYGIAAVGRPAIFVGPRACQLADFMSLHGLGVAFGRDQTKAIADAVCTWRDDPAIREEIATSALAFANASGGVARAAEAWAGLLARLAPHPAGAAKLAGNNSIRQD